MLTDLIPTYAKALMASTTVDECHVLSSQLITDVGHAVGLNLQAATINADFHEKFLLSGVRKMYASQKTLMDKLWYQQGRADSIAEGNRVESLMRKLDSAGRLRYQKLE